MTVERITRTEIKPCPFCGSEKNRIDMDMDFRLQIKCENCGAMGPPAENLHDAAWAWNRRQGNEPRRYALHGERKKKK